MGGDVLVQPTPDPDVKPPTLGDIFEKQVAYYMSLGMTWEEYWHGDNILPRVYREKQEIERDRANHLAWLNGLYQLRAIGAAMSEEAMYPDEPLPLTEEQAEEKRARDYKKASETFMEQLMIEQESRKDGEL